MNGKKSTKSFKNYFSSLHRISKAMLHAGGLISISELIALGYYIANDIKQGVSPLFAVYIPLMRSILVFAFFVLLFALTFDYVYRKERT